MVLSFRVGDNIRLSEESRANNNITEAYAFRRIHEMLGIYKTGLIIAVGLMLLYAFQGFYPDFICVFSNAFPPIIAGAAVVTSGLTLERYWHRAKGQFSIAWFYFTLGCSCGLLVKPCGIYAYS